MKRATQSWIWSLKVAARSYRTVVVLAALMALWGFAAYEWLGLPESSVLLLILALIWAIVQLFAAIAILSGIVSGPVEAVRNDSRSLPLRSLWAIDGKKFLNTLIFCTVTLMVVWICDAVFSWVNEHAVEVASFLTFHFEKPVSHVLIEEIYHVVEGVLWVILSGFLLSFFIALMRNGWGATRKQTWKLLAGCAFRVPFLTNLLSVIVFGGIAYELANWHPMVPPGFWDYAQLIARFCVVLILISAGTVFWALALARTQGCAQISDG